MCFRQPHLSAVFPCVISRTAVRSICLLFFCMHLPGSFFSRFNLVPVRRIFLFF
jgi:hypothetical protein